MRTTRALGTLLIAAAMTACGGEVAEEAYDGDAPPPPASPGLEGAATTGPSVTAGPDTTDTSTIR